MAKAVTITKSEAIKRAIEAGASLPTEGVNYIKKHYGLEVATGYFSTLKGELAKQAPVKTASPSASVTVTRPAGKSAVMPKPAPAARSSVMPKPAPAAKSSMLSKPASAAKSSVPPKPTAAVQSLDPVAFAREVKELVERFGVDAVKGMADIVKG